MERHLKALLIALALLALYAVPVAAQDDQNCDDFGSQAEAQLHFRADPSDPDGLDGDNDGIACEDNPAPYSCEYENICTSPSPSPSPDASPSPSPSPEASPSPSPNPQPKMPNTGAGGLGAGASLLIGNAAVGLVMLLGAGYAVIRRR